MADEKDPQALYHRAIVDAARAAVGAGRLENPDVSASVDNPLCGDQVTIDLHVKGGRVVAVGHVVKGCLLCEAAASLIGAHASGQTPDELRDAATQTRALVERGVQPTDVRWRDLAMFTPVQHFKSRRQCVLLPFQALLRALGDDAAGIA